jgi:hypothetical protein
MRIGTRCECDKDMVFALGEPRLTKPLIGNARSEGKRKKVSER